MVLEKSTHEGAKKKRKSLTDMARSDSTELRAHYILFSCLPCKKESSILMCIWH
jgi:hypothetical protein